MLDMEKKMSNINIPKYNLGNYKFPIDLKYDTCVDVGANVGDFVVRNSEKFKQIHFYEPFEPCFNIIKNKTEKSKNVRGFNEAVYSMSGLILPLLKHLNSDAGSNALKQEGINAHWNEEIQNTTTISLPDVLNRIGGKINYLKVDCETSEYVFLFDKDLSCIDAIGIELHWQMGEVRYNNLINHILKTHHCSEDFSYEVEKNKEVLFIKAHE
jgi:FkbM family methyltransferase